MLGLPGRAAGAVNLLSVELSGVKDDSWDSVLPRTPESRPVQSWSL